MFLERTLGSSWLLHHSSWLALLLLASGLRPQDNRFQRTTLHVGAGAVLNKLQKQDQDAGDNEVATANRTTPQLSGPDACDTFEFMGNRGSDIVCKFAKGGGELSAKGSQCVGKQGGDKVCKSKQESGMECKSFKNECEMKIGNVIYTKCKKKCGTSMPAGAAPAPASTESAESPSPGGLSPDQQKRIDEQNKIAKEAQGEVNQAETQEKSAQQAGDKAKQEQEKAAGEVEQDDTGMEEMRKNIHDEVMSKVQDYDKDRTKALADTLTFLETLSPGGPAAAPPPEAH